MVTTAKDNDRIQRISKTRQAATATGNEIFKARVVARRVDSRVNGHPVKPTKEIVDRPDNGANSLRAEYERRLGSNYKLIIEAQTFHNATPDDLTYSLRRDSFLQIALRRYF